MRAIVIKSLLLTVTLLLLASSARGQSGTWELVSAPPPGQYLVALASPSPSVFVAVGGSGRILRSENGGESWVEISSGLPVDYLSSLTDISFGTASTGTAVGRYGIILRTLDGGKSWAKQQSGTEFSLSKVFFLDENFGMVTAGVIFKTRNGGNDWETLPFNQEGAISNFVMLDTLHGIAVGPAGVTGAGTVFKTQDGGLSWDWILVDGLPFRYLNDIAFVQNKYGLIVGSQGTVLRTEDGGETWSIVPPIINDDLYGVAMRDEMNGVAVGSNGAIISSSDGGKTWRKEDSPTDSILNAVALDADGGGVIVGGEGDAIILRYQSGPSSVDELDDPRTALHVTVAPNPASHQMLIEWEGSDLSREQNRTGEIMIRNLVGEQILAFNVPTSEGSAVWDVRSLPSGIYFVTLTIGERKETRRVIRR